MAGTVSLPPTCPTRYPTDHGEKAGIAERAFDASPRIDIGADDFGDATLVVTKSTLGFHTCSWKPFGRTLFVRPMSQPLDLNSIMESPKFLLSDGLTHESIAV
jgi:hypothetical protein